MRKILHLLLLLTICGIPSTQNAFGAETDYEVVWRVPLDDKIVPAFTIWPSNFGRLAYKSVLPVCTVNIAKDCIQSVEIQNTQGEWVAGDFKYYIPIDSSNSSGISINKMVSADFPVNPISNSQMPASARSGVWNFPSISHSGGLDFLVTLWIFGNGNDDKGPAPGGNVQASVQPFSWTLKKVSQARIDEVTPYGGNVAGPNERSLCYYQLDSRDEFCTSREVFSSLAPIRLVANLEKFSQIFLSTGSWLTSRVSEPSIEIKQLSSTSIRASFTGTPIVLSSAKANFPATVENYVWGRKILQETWKAAFPNSNALDIDTSDTSCFNPTPSFSTPSYAKSGCLEAKYRALHGNFSAEDTQSFYLWQELAKVAQIVPMNRNTAWNFSTTGGRLAPEILGCTNKSPENQYSDLSPIGFIASNATVIDPKPPVWNSKNQSLDFALASFVKTENDNPSKQFYELDIQESAAQCLWKINLSTAQAKIQIFDTGANQVQRLETVSVAKNGDYIKLKVSGINVASSIIQVQLFGTPLMQAESKQDALKIAVPLDTVGSQRKTITCVKGKMSKKVVGMKPTCPKGFKLSVKGK